MSTKKILIATGDSVSSELNGTPPWSVHVAEKNNWDLISLAKPSSSNESIFNRCADEIEKHDYKDVIAIALWGDPMRLNFWDIYDQVLYTSELIFDSIARGDKRHLEEHLFFTQEVTKKLERWSNSRTLHGILYTIINHSLRQMCLFEDFCKYRKIQFYHGASYTPLNLNNLNILFENDKFVSHVNYTDYHKLEWNEQQDLLLSELKQCVSKLKEENFYYQKLENSKHFLGFDWNATWFVDENKETISEYDHHPNEKGHKSIAVIIDKFIKEGKRPSFDKDFFDFYKDPGFVYD